MKTFEEFLTEKTIPSNVQRIIADLEDEDAKILDFNSEKIDGEETYSIFVKHNSGDYDVVSIKDKNITKRGMEPAELRRYKTGH